MQPHPTGLVRKRQHMPWKNKKKCGHGISKNAGSCRISDSSNLAGLGCRTNVCSTDLSGGVIWRRALRDFSALLHEILLYLGDDGGTLLESPHLCACSTVITWSCLFACIFNKVFTQWGRPNGELCKTSFHLHTHTHCTLFRPGCVPHENVCDVPHYSLSSA